MEKALCRTLVRRTHPAAAENWSVCVCIPTAASSNAESVNKCIFLLNNNSGSEANGRTADETTAEAVKSNNAVIDWRLLHIIAQSTLYWPPLWDSGKKIESEREKNKGEIEKSGKFPQRYLLKSSCLLLIRSAAEWTSFTFFLSYFFQRKLMLGLLKNAYLSNLSPNANRPKSRFFAASELQTGKSQAVRTQPSWATMNTTVHECAMHAMAFFFIGKAIRPHVTQILS